MSLFRRSARPVDAEYEQCFEAIPPSPSAVAMQWRIEFCMDVGLKLRRSKGRMLLFKCMADYCANLAPVHAVPANCHSSQAALHWAADPPAPCLLLPNLRLRLPST